MSELLRRAKALIIAVAGSCVASAAIAQTMPSINAVRAGFAGEYKLGCWTPLQVDISGGSEPLVGSVTVTVPDGDGVPTTITTLASTPVNIGAEQQHTVQLFMRVGQNYSSVETKLLDMYGNELASRVFRATSPLAEGLLNTGRPATSRLIVELGPSIGLRELVRHESRDELSQTHIAQVDAADLPTEWYGYEGVDTIVLSASDAAHFRPLVDNRKRVAALRKWVAQGGKLVIFCGAESAELLSERGALADLIPGRYTESVEISQSQSIEAFSGAEQSITPDRRVAFQVPVFADLRGKVLATAQRGPVEVPLVIRSYIGFGELTFVGLDFDRPPLADWAGREGFLSKALDLGVSSELRQQTAGVVEVTGTDLVIPVQNTLADSFVGVSVVPFALVAVLVLGYILLIGPGDYYLANKLLKRPVVTWISLPLMVIGVSAAAYWFAHWQKGDQLRVNQVEFIDVDPHGEARGTVWTYFLTPTVTTFDLSLQPSFLQTKLESAESLTAWLGQPGYGLGGMQAAAGRGSLLGRGYTFSPALDKMVGVPVQLWSTKAITSRWSSTVTPPLEAMLNRADDELVAGRIANRADHQFEDCVLLYGQWAWNLGTLQPNLSFSIADAAQPRTVRTLLTNATAGDTTITATADDGTVPFRLANSDMTRLAKVIMFFDAINGARYSGMLNRYQGFLDMSHLLQQPDLAVLVARTKTRNSQWLDGDKPFASDQDRDWTYYRFVVPVGPPLD